MRWLFLFVLMLNLAYVGWELNQPARVTGAAEVKRDAPKIVMLNEIGQDTVAVTSIVDSTQEEKNLETSGCYTLGPFRNLEKLRSVTRDIKNHVVDASYRSHDEKEQSMFWVYLKPSKDYSTAKELGENLKEKKVRDYYIIKEGPKGNGVSLGHFREKNRAYAHAEDIKSMGFKPEVEAIFKDYTIYWLDYELAESKSTPGNMLEKHLTGKINHLVRDCS